MGSLNSISSIQKCDTIIIEFDDFRFLVPKDEKTKLPVEKMVLTIVGRITQTNIPASIAE